ncbi:unnamed protein product [Leuciscus chuanchicus]
MVCQGRSLYPGQVHSWSNHSPPQINRVVSDSKHAEEEKAEFRRKLQTWFPGIEVSDSKPSEEEKAEFKRKRKTWFPDLQGFPLPLLSLEATLIF